MVNRLVKRVAKGVGVLALIALAALIPANRPGLPIAEDHRLRPRAPRRG